MIDEIRKDVAGLWTGMIGAGKALEGIKHVQDNDENLLSDYLPGITFDFADSVSLKFLGSRWEFKPRFKATLYTTGFENRAKAVAAHLDFLCRMESGTLRGMMVAAAVLASGGYETDSGQSFKIALDPATRSFGVKGKGQFHQHWSVRTELFLDFETWLTTEQVIALSN